MVKRHKDKKELIMESAVEIFSGKLFHQVTMEEIAARAGVGKGTIYLYFESKEELFRRTIRYATDLYYSKMLEVLGKVGGPKDKLKQIISFQMDFFQTHLKVLYLLIGESMAPPLIFKEEIIEAQEKLARLVRGIIEEGVEAGEFREVDSFLAARMYLGCLTALIHDLIFNEQAGGGDLSEKFCDIFFHGISGLNRTNC